MPSAKTPPPLKPSYRQPVKRKRGEVVAEADGTPVSSDDSANNPDKEAIERRRATLSNTVGNYIRLAMSERQNSGIEEVWEEARDLYEGYDALNNPQRMVKTRDQAARAKSGEGKPSILLNIVKPKTDTGVARVSEMLVPTDDKPWEVTNTPVPEFDVLAEGGDTESVVTMADGKQVPAVMVAQMAKDEAGEACKDASAWIEDEFVEGNVYAEFRKVIRSAGRLGTGVLKGPTPIYRKKRKWTLEGAGENRVTKLEVMNELRPQSRQVQIENCFPDPACGTNIHNGSFHVERDYLTPRKLRELATDPAYDRDWIAKCLDEGPQLAIKSRSSSSVVKRREGEAINEAALFEVFYVYCDVSPDDLVLMGMADKALSDTERLLLAVPAVVTMLNGYAIKAECNPMETGEFPYDYFRWEEIEGQPWGRGIPTKMSVAQKGMTASLRKMMQNAGMAGGVQVAFIAGALRPVNGIMEVVGPKLWEFTPSDKIDDIRKAFQVFQIPSIQKDLLEMIKFFLEMADQLTNLPNLLQGEQKADTSPETLGGMKMLEQNASSPLRVIAKGYDDDLVVPHLRRYYNWGMEKVARLANAAKHDLQIAARGSTALVQREEGRELLQLLFPVKDDPSLRIDPAKLVQEFARAYGYSMKAVQYTDDEWKKKQEDLKANPPPADPRIEAANIRNEGLKLVQDAANARAQGEQQFKTQQAELQRQADAARSQVEREIEEMRLAGAQNVSLESVKAMLAKAAMDTRVKRDEMQLKVSPANPSNQGI